MFHHSTAVALVAIGCIFFAPRAFAQTPNRYLIIVDTSFSMHSRAQAVQATVESLLLSGMNGEMQRGDTLGVWTFNDKLHTGQLPLQRWTPQANQMIAVNTLKFLARQRYEKSTDLKQVLAEMFHIIADSDRITVILISDGDEKMRGTPFDPEINSVYELNHQPLKKVRIPFTTVLRAERGKITGYTVNTDLVPVKFPPLPAPPKKVEAAQTKPPEIKPPTSPPPAPSLILSGKKSETNLVAQATETVAEKKPATQSTVVTTVIESPAAVPEVKTEPANVPLPPLAIPPVTPYIPTTVPDEKPAAPVAQPAPVPVVETQIKPPPVLSAVPPAAITKPKSNPPPAPAPVQVATSVPSLSNRSIVWIIALVVVALVAVVLLLARRSRTAPQASLITRSLDKEKK